MSAANKLALLSEKLQTIDKASPARARLTKLFDENTFVEIDALAKAGENAAAVVTGYGSVDGSTVFAFSQDSSVASGALGKVHAAKIKKVYELAAKTGAPVVGVYDSKGADLTNPYDTMAAYGELLALSNNLSGVVPQVSLVLGICAGSAALIASGADFIVMSEDGEFFLTAPAASEACSAKNAAETGVAHVVAKDADGAIAAARKIISMLPLNNLAEAPIWDFAEAEGAAAALQAAGEKLDCVEAAEIVKNIADAGSVTELQASFGKKAYAALATIGGQAVGILGAAGSLGKDECAKLARIVSICDAFSIPVVTLVNTEGFEGSVRDTAMLAHVYAEATTPKVSVVLGKAYGSAYIALAGKGANADMAYAWPGAVISPLKPETAVAFLYNDRITAEKSRQAVEAEYQETEASAFAYAECGLIDAVIDPSATRAVVLSALDMLSGKRVSSLPKKHGNLPL